MSVKEKNELKCFAEWGEEQWKAFKNNLQKLKDKCVWKFEYLSQMTKNIMIQEKLRTTDLRKLTGKRVINQGRDRVALETTMISYMCCRSKYRVIFWSSFLNVPVVYLGILWITNNCQQTLAHARKWSTVGFMLLA